MKYSRTYKRNSSSEDDLKDKEFKYNNLLSRQYTNKETMPHSGMNPEYYNFISKTHNEKDKPTKKIIVAESPDKRYLGYGLNDNMNIDKNQKTIAKKGLLYLLNSLSGGVFFPSIETYFQQIKDDKKAELELKKNDPNDNNTNSNYNNNYRESNTKDNNRTVTSFNQEMTSTPKVKKLRNDLVERENNIVNKFKKRNPNDNNNDKEDEGYGIKEFNEDREKNKAQKLGNKSIMMNGNNSNTKPVIFKFNKEKQARNELNMKEGKKKKKKKIQISSKNDNETYIDYESANMFVKKAYNNNDEDDDSSL